MIELTTATLVACLIVWGFLCLLATFNLGGEDPYIAPFIVFVPLVFAVLLFKELTFQDLFTYSLYYFIGVVLWFFIKWILEIRSTIAKLKKLGFSSEKHKTLSYSDQAKFSPYIYEGKDKQIHVTQPSFSFLLAHSIVFPFSIIEELFDNLLRGIYNWIKKTMQAFADSFLP